jgi:membrane protease YdiL (CAAX protease family)
MPEPQTLRPRDWAAVVVALVLPSIVTWIYFFGAEDQSAGVQLAVFNTVKILQFALPIVWVLFVQRGRIRLKPESLSGVALGIAFGLVVFAAALGLYYGYLKGAPFFAGAGKEIRGKLAGWKIDGVAEYAALGVFYSLLHSLLEEYYWRWFVFGQLRRAVSVRTAIVVSALGFMAHHVLVLGKYFGFASPAAWLLSACVAVGGAFWAWLYHRSGSLLGPWASHMLVDAAIFLAGYDIVRGQLG